MLKVLLVFGTRPEAIKLAPLYRELKNHPQCDVKVCVTGQHRQMLDQVLEIFDMKPDFDLNIMKAHQDLFDVTSNCLMGLKSTLKSFRPDFLCIHGDTTTTFAASVAGFYEKIPVAHIEAGLRTGDLYAPWPEEFNRRAASLVSSLHFAPTETSRNNLLREGVSSDRIFVTGNTVIDALLFTSRLVEEDQSLKSDLDARFAFLDKTRKLILVTGHRRENFGHGFEKIFSALRDVVTAHSNVEIIYPVHLNPQVKEPAERILGSSPVAHRIHLIEPQDYPSFVYLMKLSSLIITDSGGVQEEAPSLGKPVLVTRDVTERPEAVEAGTVRLVGTDPALLCKEVDQLLSNQESYDRMTKVLNPYGDGLSSQRIVSTLLNFSNLKL